MLRRTFFKGLIGLIGMMMVPSAANTAISVIKPEDSDIVKWAESNIILNSPNGKEKIKLLPIQKHILNSWMDNQFSITVSCRQSGKSTLAMIHALYICIHHPNYQYAILDGSFYQCKHTMDTVSYMLNGISNIYPVSMIYSKTKNEIVFKNGSRLFCDFFSPVSIRGRRIDTLNLQEFDFNKNQKELLASVFPCIGVSPQGKIIMASTLSPDLKTEFKKILYTPSDKWKVEEIYYSHIPRIAENIEQYKSCLDKDDFNREYCNIL